MGCGTSKSVQGLQGSTSDEKYSLATPPAPPSPTAVLECAPVKQEEEAAAAEAAAPPPVCLLSTYHPSQVRGKMPRRSSLKMGSSDSIGSNGGGGSAKNVRFDGKIRSLDTFFLSQERAVVVVGETSSFPDKTQSAEEIRKGAPAGYTNPAFAAAAKGGVNLLTPKLSDGLSERAQGKIGLPGFGGGGTRRNGGAAGDSASDGVPPSDALREAIQEGDVDLVHKLAVLGKGVEQKILMRGSQKWTPLHVAAHAGQVAVVQDLLDLGADSNAMTSPVWETPLHLASAGGFVDVVEVLYAGDADPLEIDKQGCSAAHSAARGGHADVLRYLKNEQGMYMDDQDAAGMTPLHHAAMWLRGEAVRVLVEELGAAPGEKDVGGLTPLMLAMGKKREPNGMTEEEQWAQTAVLVPALLGAGGTTGGRDSRGDTCLHYAAKTLDVEAVRALCGAGADTSLKNGFGKGRTPREEADRYLEELISSDEQQERARQILDILPKKAT